MYPSCVYNGRLGHWDASVANDPRAHPNLVSGTVPPELMQQTPTVFSPEDMDFVHENLGKGHHAFTNVYELQPYEWSEDAQAPELKEEVITIDGLDKNKIKLHVYRRADLKDLAPAVVYIHGGGMVVLDTINGPHVRWHRALAYEGLVVVALDFRNGWSPEGRKPFPAGLNDCVAGIKYVIEHQAELGISKVTIQGESGGANLSLATTLRAKREGWSGGIAGVYASVPYISNGYSWSKERKLQELPSLAEFDGYLLNAGGLAESAWYYTDDADRTNPLAWPYYATKEDMEGLPPHHLSMDELDPLKDEGLTYFRKLLAAGVPTTGTVNLAIPHAGSIIFRQLLVDNFRRQVADIAAFAKRI